MQGHSGGRVGGCHRKTSLQPSVDHETASLLLVFPRYPRETPENVGKMQMLKNIYINSIFHGCYIKMHCETVGLMPM